MTYGAREPNRRQVARAVERMKPGSTCPYPMSCSVAADTRSARSEAGTRSAASAAFAPTANECSRRSPASASSRSAYICSSMPTTDSQYPPRGAPVTELSARMQLRSTSLARSGCFALRPLASRRPRSHCPAPSPRHHPRSSPPAPLCSPLSLVAVAVAVRCAWERCLGARVVRTFLTPSRRRLRRRARIRVLARCARCGPVLACAACPSCNT